MARRRVITELLEKKAVVFIPEACTACRSKGSSVHGGARVYAATLGWIEIRVTS